MSLALLTHSAKQTLYVTYSHFFISPFLIILIPLPARITIIVISSHTFFFALHFYMPFYDVMSLVLLSYVRSVDASESTQLQKLVLTVIRTGVNINIQNCRIS